MTQTPARTDNGFAFMTVTALFFMWGFISCMNELLLPKFKADFSLTRFQANLVQFAFFGACFLVSFTYFLISSAKEDPINKIGYAYLGYFGFYGARADDPTGESVGSVGAGH